APIAFVASGFPAGKITQDLEAWAAKATVNPGKPDITYEPGNLVMHDAEMYECLQSNANQVPSEHPESWKKLPLPADDFRVTSGSRDAGMGVHLPIPSAPSTYIGNVGRQKDPSGLG